MEKMYELKFGILIEDCAGNIVERQVFHELLVSVRCLSKFIRDFEEQSGTVLLSRNDISLKNYYYQLKLDI